jgi:tRNA A-37 threonylcarbamoyl transferase component Bud32
MAPGAIPADRFAFRGPAGDRDAPRAVSLQSEARGLRPPGGATALLRDAGIDLVVLLQVEAGVPRVVLALGPKRSEQPYETEDLELLDAIASSLVLLLEAPERTPVPVSQAFEECPRCGTCYDSGAPSCTLDRSSLVAVGMPRTLAGRYRLDRRLGRGGMGMVYEAQDVALGRHVAVKLIRDEWIHSASAASRFEREARVVAGLAHPNVVSVYDYGVEAGTRAFLVMELLQGGTLREEIQRAGPLDPKRTLAILRGVSRAVEAAHQQHLVHRDLKPDNIFLVRDGSDPGADVKVLDFGVAKPISTLDDQQPKPPSAADTELGVLVGTVGYMSPEQLLGEPPAVSWDVWALAVVAYESLTGVLPFPVPSREVWRQSVLAGRFTPVTRHVAGLPARCDEVFARAFAMDRRGRHPSGPDLVTDLAGAFAS